MADRSNIEWTDATWNPIRARNKKTGKVGFHCEHATTGCIKCYAEGLNKWIGTGLPFKPGHRDDVDIFLDETMLRLPLTWKKPRRIFVCSMTDLFADFVPDEFIDKMFAVMALSPQHTFQVLTKRAARMRDYMRQYRGASHWMDLMRTISPPPDGHGVLLSTVDGCLRNVWLGVSAERQAEADERIPALLQTPAAVRFISAEPLLGPIDFIGTLARFQDDRTAKRQCAVPLGMQLIDWVIAGGESGRQARPMHPAWAQSLRDQCAAAGIAFFFKQWGEWAPSTPDQASGSPQSGWMTLKAHPHVARAEELYPEAGAAFIERVGKKAAGRLLDGVEHNGFPEVQA